MTDTSALSALATCTTYRGAITVSAATVGHPAQTNTNTGSVTGEINPRIRLDGIETLVGDLDFRDNVAYGDDSEFGIAAPDLNSISGSLSFSNMSALFMPEFTALTSAQSISFQNVQFVNDTTWVGPEQFPALESVLALSLQNTTATKLGFWNTSVVLLPPNNWTEITKEPFTPLLAISATKNPVLNDVSFSGYAANATHVLAYFADNGNDLHIDLPLFANGSLRVRNATTFSAPDLRGLYNSTYYTDQLLAAMPDFTSSLRNWQDDLAGFTNNSFTSLKLTSLTEVDDSYSISRNPQLQQIDFLSLKSVERLKISGNKELSGLSFESLTAVNTALSIDGPLNVLAFPSLTDASGNLTIKATGSYRCDRLDTQQHRDDIVKGTYTCKSAPWNGGLSKGAKTGVGIGVAIGVLALLAMGVLTWLRIRSRRRSTRPIEAKHRSSAEGGEEEALAYGEQAELAGTDVKELEPILAHESELPAGKQAQELHGGHGASELGEGKIRYELDGDAAERQV